MSLGRLKFFMNCKVVIYRLACLPYWILARWQICLFQMKLMEPKFKVSMLMFNWFIFKIRNRKFFEVYFFVKVRGWQRLAKLDPTQGCIQDLVFLGRGAQAEKVNKVKHENRGCGGWSPLPARVQGTESLESWSRTLLLL